MIAVTIIAIIALIIVLIVNLDYKNHCIEDLEERTKTLSKIKNGRTMRILLHIQEMTDIRKCYSIFDIRKYVDEEIEKLSREERTK